MTVYAAGTVSVETGSKVATFSGALVSEINFRVGDTMIIDGEVQHGATVGVLLDDSHIEFVNPFTGPAGNGLPYVSTQNSPRWNQLGPLNTMFAEQMRLIGEGILTKANYALRSELFSDLTWPGDALGKVFADTGSSAGVPYKGLYKKTGPVGAGSWQRIGDLPEADAAAADAAEAELAKLQSQGARDLSVAARNVSQLQAGIATEKAEDAKAAAEASGTNVTFFDTYALATAGLAALPSERIVEVFNDETRGGARTRYRKQGAGLTFKTVAGMDIDDRVAPTVGTSPVTVRSELEEGKLRPRRFSAVADNATDVTVAFQAMINAAVSLASTAGDTMGAMMVEPPSGKYKLLGTVAIPPWVHVGPLGNVLLNWSQAPTNVVGVRSSNAGAPAGTSPTAPGNRAPFLTGDRGALQLLGPGAVGTSVGLDLGQAATGPDRDDYRNVKIRDVVLTAWATAVLIRKIDTHQMLLEGVRLEQFLRGLRFEEGLVTNSGERMAFQNMEFGAAPDGWAIECNADSFDLYFTVGSVDFVRNGALLMGGNCAYQRISFVDYHFEGSCGDALIKRVGGSLANNVVVCVSRSKILPTTSESAVPAGARADGLATPYTALFKGAFKLTLEDVIVSYTKPYHLATQGLFMCDESVDIARISNLHFNAWTQFPARKMIANRNSNFDQATVGADLIGVGVPGWTVKGYSGVTGVVDDTRAFAPSTKSLKLTSTSANGFLRLESDPFPMDRLKRVLTKIVAWGGTSVGNMQMLATVRYWRRRPRARFSITAITKGTTLVTATADVAHGMEAGEFVYLFGFNQAEYNRRQFIETVLAGVASATVTSGGSGYSVAPTVSFSGGGGGSGAAATAQISGGVVIGITITNPGSGYASSPVITLSGGDGSGAAASAVLSRPTQFTFRIASSTPAPTGSPQARAEELEFLGAGAQTGSSFKVLYDDSDQPNHTGNRLYWCRSRNDPYALDAPAGTELASIELEAGQLGVGDAINLGEYMAGVIG
ncbi:hypothetical protein ASG47_19765 [Devosia sp. Leaf420]|uniref:hypothetical protein n=1 Tax=Devosia sp. Leaf420 TaxID=1736374 RepID=UPI0007163DDE|nr:hypothetical protein [Devosia sp. Leaf420]KQT50343.1 hypothetical protein ASG47_19765 [Devosia sp. Leaf420]